MYLKTFFTLAGFYCCNYCQAQTLDRWASLVNWDGVSHWSKYIQTTPAYMGPNALSVPFIGNGSVDSNNYIGATTHLHFSKGDNTQNLALQGNYALVNDVVSLDLYYVPFETFRMNDDVKQERHVYYTHYYDNKARGDVVLNTNIRLLKKLDKKIRLALRVGYRFPTSTDLQSARFTDGMGYYFDVSFGKPLSPSLQWIGMTGFYCWQLNTLKYHQQDDAFLFGTGLEWNKNGWKVQGYTAGYIGYFRKGGDKPIVLRAHVEKRSGKAGLLLRLQQGVNDFKYTSMELGVKYFLRKKD